MEDAKQSVTTELNTWTVRYGLKVRQSKPSHSSNQQTWEFLFQTRVAIHNTFTSRGWSPSFAALGNLARRTALRRKRRRFSSTGSSGIWPHRASFNAFETRKQARQEKHREHNKTKWRKDSGHVPTAPSLGHTRCKSHQKVHARRELEHHLIPRIRKAPACDREKTRTCELRDTATCSRTRSRFRA